MCCHKDKTWTLQATQQCFRRVQAIDMGRYPEVVPMIQIDWTLQATHHSTSQVQSFSGDIVARVQAMEPGAQNNGTCHQGWTELFSYSDRAASK